MILIYTIKKILEALCQGWGTCPFGHTLFWSDPCKSVSLLEMGFYFHRKPARGSNLVLVGSHQNMLGIQYITWVWPPLGGNVRIMVFMPTRGAKNEKFSIWHLTYKICIKLIMLMFIHRQSSQKVHLLKKIGKKRDHFLKIRPKVLKNEPKLRKVSKNWYFVQFSTKNQ